MKHKLLIAALCGAVMAPMAVSAKSAEELRIYINPGHGSWTGGDRNMGTIKHGEPQTLNDTCGFFESNTNLWKCLGLVDRLEEYGLKLDRTKNQDNPVRANVGAARDLSNNIFMSRVKNGPGPDSDEDDEAYNRSLSEISAEVQRNNFDLFISVHSNAASDDFVNYPGFFVRGENGVASVEGSDVVSKIAWPFAYSVVQHNWSNYAIDRPNVIYDIDFWQGDHLITSIDGVQYKGYYGVLRHGVLGYMVEGYFHTYGPDRHRAMNPDVCREEGDGYARGIAEIFGIEKESTGTIYGIVRDKHEKFRHKYYNATAKSNDNFKPLNDVLVVLKKDGETVASYTTDDEWNGAFVFTHLEPGTYYVEVTAEGYKEANPEECGPYVVEAAKSVYPNIWLENENYVQEEVPLEEYVDEVNSPLIKAADSYKFTTAVAAKAIPELEGKTIRRLLVRGENVVVLALDEAQKPTLLLLDADLNVVTALGTEVCKGSDRDLADVQFTADGVLIGSSESITHYSSATIDNEDFDDTERGSVNFYRWDNGENGLPAGEANLWFTSLASGNLYRGATANTFVYTGTVDNGTFCFPTASSYGAERMFFSYIDVIDGEVQSFSINNSGLNTDYLCVSYLGHDYTFTLAPYNKEVFIVNAPGVPSRAFNISSLQADSDLSEELLDNDYAGAAFFKYAGHSFMAAAGENGPALIDVTDGLDAANAVEVVADGATAANAAAGRTVVTFDNDGIAKRADIEIVTVAGNTIAKYTTAGVEQPVEAGVFAYGLALESEDNVYTLSFRLSGDANARVELIGNEETVVAAQGSYVKGLNTVTLDVADYPETEYKWQVVVENKAVPTLAAVYTNTNVKSSGIVINTDTESEAYGQLYLSSWNERAIYSIAPDMQFSEPYLKGMWDTNVGASPWRLALLPNGKLLISDWGDVQGGIYLFNPADPEAGRSNFFAGTCNPASGEWTYEGKVIGGSTAGMAILGTGEDTRLYSFQEDYPSDYALSMVCYHIGTAEQITAAPEETFSNLSRYLINGNVNVIATDDYMVLGQVRGAGNNTKGVPSFLIGSYDDEVLFNSADLDLNGSAGGFALSAENRLFVMDASNDIRAYDIDLTKEEDQLTEVFAFSPSAAGTAYQMTFDPAGNLYIAGRSALQVYALPREAEETVTPAASTQTIKVMTGVESALVDEASDAPAVYYNLQGIQVDPARVVPGVYIERRGNISRKVVINK